MVLLAHSCSPHMLELAIEEADRFTTARITGSEASRGKEHRL